MHGYKILHGGDLNEHDFLSIRLYKELIIREFFIMVVGIEGLT